MHNKIRKIRWLLVLLLAVLPLLFLSRFFEDIKLEDMVRNRTIYKSVAFTYAEGRTVGCFLENPENPDAICYVFLPAFADLDGIFVETDIERVDFAYGGSRISVRRDSPGVFAFEGGVIYDMVFYDRKDREVAREPVMFLRSGKLPTLYVTTESGSMEKLDADKKYSEKGAVELVDQNGELILADTLDSISGRGNQTFTYEKKSYQIDLKSSADLFGMGASKTWILLCNVYDPSYIRNKITYDMAIRAGMEGSPASEYMDVYFNGVYAGMYLLTEKVEFGENRLEYADLESQNRMLNGTGLSGRADYLSEDGSMKGKLLAVNPSDITGGYLIEHDYGDKFDDVTSGFITRRGDRYSLKNPKNASKEELTYISALMQEIEDAIFSEDGYNPDTGKHFTEYIDLESWADKYLVEEITRNNGGGTTSSYFYKPSDAVSKKVFGGPVWDYDKGFGRSEGYNKNTRDLAFMTLHWQYTAWFYHLYQHEEFVEAVKAEYREKFSGQLSEIAEEWVDEYADQIRESAVLDWARFQHVYRGEGYEALDFDGHVEYVRQFIRSRKEFLDEVWLEDAPVCIVQFKEEDGTGEKSVGIIKGECMQTLPVMDDAAREFAGWKIAGTDEFFTTQTPVTQDMSVICVWKDAGQEGGETGGA